MRSAVWSVVSVVFIGLFFAALPGPGPSSSADRVFIGALKEAKTAPGWVELVFERGRVRVSERAGGLLRIKATNESGFRGLESFALLDPRAPETAPRLEEREDRLVLSGSALTITVFRSSGRMEIADSGGVILSEPEEGGIFFIGDAAGCLKVMPADEHYYGFGEKTGPLDKRGRRMVMWNTDVSYGLDTDPLYQSHPFFLAVRSGRAYGLFFDNTFRSEFDMGLRHRDRMSFQAAGGELDYWVIPGPGPREVLSGYGRLTGTMPLPPLWGLGYHQCRWSYKNENRVREVRDGFKKRGIPLDAIYLDIHYMNGYRVFTFNARRFPDPAGLFAELKEDGVRTVVIVDPGIKIDPDYEPYREGLERDYFALTAEGEPFTARVWPGKVHFPDFLKPEVRAWWGRLHKFYTDLGVDGIWNDMNEPAGWERDYWRPWSSRPPDWDRMLFGDPPDQLSHARVRNVYALLEAEATFRGLLELQPGLRPFVISRAGFSGIQRYALAWTGDNSSTWGHLALSLPMQLNMGLSGLAFVGSDVGGFHGSPSSELFARWMQVGAFSPFFRNHTVNNSPDQEPWEFGDEVTAISREIILLRYRLLPYTYSLFWQAHRKNWPIQRAMVFEFPDDENVKNLADQFMWGEWLLVAPVIEKGRTRRRVYLPAGGWFDVHEGRRFEGPAWIEAEAPLSRLPIFAREGAIIPMAPAMLHTSEKPWDPLTLEVFPGSGPSSFELYEDDGQSLDYQTGNFSLTPFEQRPVPGGLELMIGKRTGSYVPARNRLELQVHGLPAEARVSLISPEGKSRPASAASFDQEARTWLIRLDGDRQGWKVRIISGEVR